MMSFTRGWVVDVSGDLVLSTTRKSGHGRVLGHGSVHHTEVWTGTPLETWFPAPRGGWDVDVSRDVVPSAVLGDRSTALTLPRRFPLLLEPSSSRRPEIWWRSGRRRERAGGA